MAEYFPPIIGLCGPPGAGKDTVAAMIPGARRVAFADPIYDGLSAMVGLSVDSLRDRGMKERVIPWLGKSPRQLLQTLGTEWGRECVSSRVWIDVARQRWLDTPYHKTVVVPDVRFANEAEEIHDCGGTIWYVYRDVPPVAPHVSESGVPLSLVDRLVANTGTTDDLRERVRLTLIAAGITRDWRASCRYRSA